MATAASPDLVLPSRDRKGAVFAVIELRTIHLIQQDRLLRGKDGAKID